jgi:lipoprotein Spr
VKFKLVFILYVIAACNAGSVSAQVAFADSCRNIPCSAFSNITEFPDDSFYEPLAETVCEWLGTPYCYSGDSKRGIDCSGFVSMLYRKIYNINLAENTKEIFSNDVTAIKKQNLEPSDLVFFKIHRKRVSHVGIYLGNNKFAHATVKHGVTISDLSDPYYKKYFFKAGRVKELVCETANALK